MNWNEEYYDYLASSVCTRQEKQRYSRILHLLASMPFTYTSRVSMDGNRAADGIELRPRFADDYKAGRYYADILNTIDQVDCSLLEMMVALSIRIERDIMNDDFVGDRTGLWFWTMMDSIGINMPDSEFDESEAQERIDICLERGYDYEGHGSFFTVHNPPQDMRDTDVWYQANWWLAYEFAG